MSGEHRMTLCGIFEAFKSWWWGWKGFMSKHQGSPAHICLSWQVSDKPHSLSNSIFWIFTSALSPVCSEYYRIGTQAGLWLLQQLQTVGNYLLHQYPQAISFTTKTISQQVWMEKRLSLQQSQSSDLSYSFITLFLEILCPKSVSLSCNLHKKA